MKTSVSIREYTERTGSEQSPENAAESGKCLCSVHYKTLQKRNLGKKGECQQKWFWKKKPKPFICILGVININFKYVNNIYWDNLPAEICGN